MDTFDIGVIDGMEKTASEEGKKRLRRNIGLGLAGTALGAGAIYALTRGKGGKRAVRRAAKRVTRRRAAPKKPKVTIVGKASDVLGAMRASRM